MKKVFWVFYDALLYCKLYIVYAGYSNAGWTCHNLSKKFEVAQKLPTQARAQLKKFIATLAKANNIPEE